MVKIDCLIFGYRKLKIAPEDLSEVTSIFIRSSIFSSISDDGSIIVKERELSKIKALLSGRIDFACSEPMGLYGKWLRLPHKAAIVSAMILSLIITAILSSVVWDVRVSGNETLDESEVLDVLKDCGFGVGDIWLMVDRSKLEYDLLNKNEKIAWVNINRRGTVAYVRIIENRSEEKDEEPTEEGYNNIIAAQDCVIEEITVKRGTAVVKPGDVVKKGDLLVAGILPAEAGGGFCHAEASVIGRVYDKVSVEMPRNYEKKTYIGKRIAKIELNFFNFSVNIFKIYGNLTNNCDIIEDELTYTHQGKSRLPFSLTVAYLPIFDTQEADYTDEELVDLVSDRLDLITSERLREADLLKIRTSGEFTEDGYYMYSELVFLCQVGEYLNFK